MPETVGEFELAVPGDINSQYVIDLLPRARTSRSTDSASVRNLPEIDAGVFTMNLEKATDITLGAEEMRGEARRLSMEGIQPLEQSIPSVSDLVVDV